MQFGAPLSDRPSGREVVCPEVPARSETPTRAGMTTRERRSPQGTPGDRRSAGHGAKSEALRKRAILALLSEKTMPRAAAKCGVSEKTLRRWLADDAVFKTAYAEARHSAFNAGMGRVQALTARAVDTLEDLLDAKEYPNVRLGAARTVAEMGFHQHDAETILRKLEEIESAQQR